MNFEDKIKYNELSPSLQAMLDNKLEENEFIIHDENMIRHIIQEERNYWNSVEGICKKYTDEEIEKLRDWTKKKYRMKLIELKKKNQIYGMLLAA